MNGGEKSESEILVDQALKLFNDGDYKAALELARKIEEASPDHFDEFNVWRLIANSCFFLNDYDESIRYLKKLVKMFPYSEEASTCLFWTLTEANRKEDAFSEIKRFLFLRDSGEYEEYLIGHLKALQLALGEEEKVVGDIKRELREGDTTGLDTVTKYIFDALN